MAFWETIKALQQKPNDVQTSVSIIQEYSKNKNGLDEEELLALVNVILAQKLTFSSSIIKQLITTLQPRTKVKEITIINALGILNSKVQISVKAYFLKWIISIDQYLTSKKLFSNCYGILFHYLGYDTLRPHLCQILYGITCREHVKPFRCRKLIELYEDYGNEPGLVWLILLYQTYSPTSFPFTLKKPSSFFTDMTLKESSFVTVLTQKNKVSIHDIVSYEDLGKNIERFEFPNQIGSILNSKMLQHAFSCQNNQGLRLRLSDWINQSLLELYFRTDQTPQTQKNLSNFLDQIILFFQFSQEESIHVEQFLSRLIKTWDGITFDEQIFHLISLICPKSFQDFYQKFLKPLQKLFFCSKPLWKAKLIRSLRHVILNCSNPKVKSELTQHIHSMCILALQSDDHHVIIQYLLESNNGSSINSIIELKDFC